jgi:hypothetical protein
MPTTIPNNQVSAESIRRRPSWQLKIELLDITPTIWRRIVIPDSIRLPRLDRVIQAAFGWTNSHLHEFIIGGVHYAIPDPDFPELDHKDERRVTLH